MRALAAPAALLLLVALAGCEKSPPWFGAYDVTPVDVSDTTEVNTDGTDSDVDFPPDVPDTGRTDVDEDADTAEMPPDAADASPDSSGECGSFAVECRGVETGDPFRDSSHVPPEWEVECRVRWDEEPTVSDFEIVWSLEDRPDGSDGSVESNGSEAIVFVDEPGEYLVAVEVASGSLCTASAGANVIARGRYGLIISLTWETPADPDRADRGVGVGADMDLHFLHPDGCWGQSPWDINYLNKEADWGDPGSADDDPVMDRDDSDGWGPENILWSEPVAGSFRIAVHYYKDWGYGPSTATVRIRVFGVLVAELGPMELEASDDWWIAGAYHHPSGEVTAINETYSLNAGEFPPCE
jgi:predicted small lipoprotein YifL